MNKKRGHTGTVKWCLAAVIGLGVVAQSLAAPTANEAAQAESKPAATATSLTPPAAGSIPVAFLISDGAVMIDFTGPWEVFQDVDVPGRHDTPFRLYTVA